MPPNFKFSADNGYSIDENTTCLEEKGLDRYISTKKLSKKQNKYSLWDNPFQKDNFNYDAKINNYICLMGEILYRKNIRIQKQTKNKLLD